jgi:FkbM family methyltransferase
MITKVLNLFYLETYDEDEHVSRMCREKGMWEPDVTDWMKNNLEQGWSCLDVGSNIGYFTELMSRIVGPDGSVIAFEPNPKLYNDYKKVMSHNDYSGCAPIEIYKFGLSDNDSKEILVVPISNIGGASVKYNSEHAPAEWDRVEIDLKKYDDLPISDLSVDFIKMDIEGAEPDAFRGMSLALENCQVILVELGPHHPEDFLKEISEKYNMYEISGDKEIEIGTERITSHPHHINVVLRKK